MTAETCGMSAMPAKVAPPLKSTRTKLSASDEWVIARASTRVRSTSDLPEPVAPMTRPCGPMPCCADSLMSSETTCALDSPTPIGTRSRSRCSRGRQAASGSKSRTSPRPSRSTSSVEASGSRARSGSAPAYRGASRRAAASACTDRQLVGDAVGGLRAEADDLRAARRPARGPRAAGCPRARRRVRARGSSSHRSGRSSTVTPRTPSSVTIGVARRHVTAVDDDEHVRQRRAGRLGPNRGRSRRPAGSSGSRSVHRRRPPCAPARRRRARAGSARAGAT